VCVLTALPARLVIGPEMMDFGISVASVALAEGSEELIVALSDLWKAVEGVRSSFQELLKSLKDIDGAVSQASGMEIRKFLENVLTAECKSTEGEKKLSALIMRPKFQAIISQGSVDHDFNDLCRFLDEWRSLHIPTLRQLRLIAIQTIFKRVADSGVVEAILDDTFPQTFLNLPLDQSESWQETAYLLASSNTARRLLSSMHDGTTDRTDDLTSI